MDLSKDNSDSVCSRKQTGCIKEGFDQMSPAHAKHLKPVARLLREPGRNRLNSWKEIAAHLDREVRTVQRWEKREGLPVWRHFHSKASSVYAFKNEVDAWLHSRRRTIVATLSRSGRFDGGPLGTQESQDSRTIWRMRSKKEHWELWTTKCDIQCRIPLCRSLSLVGLLNAYIMPQAVSGIGR